MIVAAPSCARTKEEALLPFEHAVICPVVPEKPDGQAWAKVPCLIRSAEDADLLFSQYGFPDDLVSKYDEFWYEDHCLIVIVFLGNPDCRYSVSQIELQKHEIHIILDQSVPVFKNDVGIEMGVLIELAKEKVNFEPVITVETVSHLLH